MFMKPSFFIKPLGIFSLLFFCTHLFAQVITNQSSAPAQPVATGSYFIANNGDAKYVPPTNSYNDGVTAYYFITQDAAKTGTTSVTYNSANYPVTTIVTSDISYGGPAAAAFGANKTIFFDDGTYTENTYSGNTYVLFNYANFSMVGLHNGAVTIKKALNTSSLNERNTIANKNVYFENLIFDGQGINMVASNRGYYYFFLSGAAAPWDGSSGFVMKNCVIQNIGSSNSTFGTNKNVAINIYSSAGQHNFENVSFSNIKTQGAYAVIGMDDTKDNYFKDITINGSASNSNSYPIKVENLATNISNITTLSNVFASSLTITNFTNSYIYIQDYRYGQTSVPSNYRYVAARTSNGSTSSPAALVGTTLPSTDPANTAYWDLNDNYWIARSTSNLTIQAQLGYISSVLTTTDGLASTAAYNPPVPPANIKLSPNSSGSIPTFTQPNMGTRNVNIVAVNNYSDPYNSTTLIPFVSGGTINLNSNTAPTTKLYNFDFHQLAYYTMEEAVTGRIAPATLTDPNETATTPPTGYPLYATYGSTSSPTVINSSNTTFENCKFTSLIQELKRVNTPTATATIAMGSTQTFTAAISDNTTNSYTNTGYTNGIQNTAADQTIHYYSSDPSIVTVDEITGMATPQSPGSAVIYAKAIDSYNQGEIEKPWIQWDVLVTNPLSVTFSTITAEMINGDLEVSWTTVNEKNNSHFEIEASIDGTVFKKIGTVNSKLADGNSNSIIHYDFKANASNVLSLFSLSLLSLLFLPITNRRNRLILGMMALFFVLVGIFSCSKKDNIGVDNTNTKIYIRIAQIDKDGSKAYSKIVQVVKE
jgi:hypothetical protein